MKTYYIMLSALFVLPLDATPKLHKAILNNNTEELAKLSTDKELLFEKDDEGNSALLVAIDQGNEDLVMILLQKGLDPAEANNEGNNALHSAVLGKNMNLINRIKEKKPELITATNKAGQLPLHLASLRGDVFTVDEVYKEDLREAQDALGLRPVHYAVQNPDINVLFYWLQEDIDKNATTKSGDTPLHLASLLLNREEEELSDPPHADGQDMVQALIEDKVDTQAKNTFDITPLHNAALVNEKSVQLLLDAGADPNALDESHKTALHYAVEASQQRTAEKLIPLMKSLDIQDSQGNTALHLAAEKAMHETVKSLLDKGADATLTNKLGQTAFERAKKELVRMQKSQEPLNKTLKLLESVRSDNNNQNIEQA